MGVSLPGYAAPTRQNDPSSMKRPLHPLKTISFLKTNYRLMQVKRIAEYSKGEHSAILLTFIKLPFVIKIFVLSIYEWPFYTGFTVWLGSYILG